MTDLNTVFDTYTGTVSKVGEYNKYCNMDYPTSIKDWTTNTIDFRSYDSKTGVLMMTTLYGVQQTKYYCDGGAQALAVATMAVATVAVTIY